MLLHITCVSPLTSNRKMHRFLLILPTLCSYTTSVPVGDITATVHGNYPSTNIILTPFNTIGNKSKNAISQIFNSKVVSFSPPFPDSGRKYAVPELESIISQKDSAYGRLHEFVASFYNPKPIVDTIQEHEKYGNDGGKIRSVGVAVVGGYEALSNLLNAAIEVPFEVAKQAGRKISNSLNTYGAKLVGLAKRK